MTTHLFSNTFCKLEILFKLQRLKNERKEAGKKGGENLRSREKNASIHKQGMQFVQSTTQIVQFSSGSKAFFFFFKHFFSAIPLELEHNTKYTVIELCKITHRGLWEAFESTLTILNYSTLKLFSNVIINRADINVCMHILNACEVTMLKTLAFVERMTSSAVEIK